LHQHRLQSLRGPSASGAASEATRVEDFPALPPRLRAGDRLGPYRIGEEIARGATASVYAADLRDSARAGTRRRAALKVLSAHLTLLPRGVERFRREHELARSVRHDAILPVDERGEAQGHAYFAMPRESGRTLADLGGSDDRTPAFFERTALALSRIADALAALHRARVVHRDVKPENILLAEDGGLRLCDFGSAIDAKDLEDPGELWGTVAYLPPEQLRPGFDPADPSMDVYALGLCLYEAATGARAFPRLPADELARFKLGRLPPAPRSVEPAIPLGLEAIIRQAIEPDPRFRHPSAEALASDLERFGSGKRGRGRS
jgi:serine/threonine protein kinase